MVACQRFRFFAEPDVSRTNWKFGAQLSFNECIVPMQPVQEYIRTAGHTGRIGKYGFASDWTCCKPAVGFLVVEFTTSEELRLGRACQHIGAMKTR
jgi:hypothetical protein